MTKTLIKPLAISLGVLSIFFAGSQVKSRECQKLYGGGEICPKGEVMIDKLVWNVPGAVYVDNLGVNDYKYSVDQEVMFKLKVKNTSSVFIDKVDVFDFLPEQVEYLEGPGTYDKNTREVRFEARDFDAGEVQEFYVKAKVKSNENVCPVNKAEARIAENTDSDTSQFCIGKPVVAKLPEAGPADSLMILLSSGMAGFAGLKLIKKSKIRE